MTKFVGRSAELKDLTRFMDKTTASLLIIRGRRRVGKSRLLEEFGKKFDHFYEFMGMPPEKNTTLQEQIDAFSNQLSNKFAMPNAKYNDWDDIFWALNEKIPPKGKTLLVLDEISWMGSKDHNFLAKFKTAWDTKFKKHSNLILIICGSASAWIDKNILSNTGFVGRVSYTLTLEELPINVCHEFWPNNVSKSDIIKVLSVTGGIPKYLEEINPHLSAEQNIKQLCFIKGGLLVNEFEQIFSNVFLHDSEIYRGILRCLVNGPQTRQELIDTMQTSQGGRISDYLEELQLSGFIKRDYTWNIDKGEDSQISKYRISDNYIRFYLRYIEKNMTKIERNSFDYQSLATFTNWSTIFGLQFENLVLNNRRLIHKALNISSEEIICENPFFQNATTRSKGCQIDYMVQTRFSNLYICEIKSSSNIIGMQIIQELQQKIDRLVVPKQFSFRPVLIHINGVQEEVYNSMYFAKIIDFSDFIRPA
jgi:AAA+ ATPase superfamily predicted ATPase